MLLVTGLYLVWNYRPSASLPFGFVQPEAPADSLPDTMRDVHRWAAWVVTFAAIALVVLAIGTAWSRRRAGPVFAAIGVLLVTFVATVSGSVLPWEQLALRAVTPGVDYHGFTAITRDEVRSVLLQGDRISTAGFLAWFRVHAIVIPIVLVGLAVVLVLSLRRTGGVREGP